MRDSRLMRAITLTAALLVLAGCHYKITDVGTGKTYYTTDIKRQKETGTISFKDALSDSKVTLQSYEIKEIDEEEYKESVGE